MSILHIIIGALIACGISALLQWMINEGKSPFMNISGGIWIVSEIAMAGVLVGLVIASAVIGTWSAWSMLAGYAAVRTVVFFVNKSKYA